MSNLTFKQLKEQLKTCKDPNRELQIRVLMKKKYLEYRLRKKNENHLAFTLTDDDFLSDNDSTENKDNNNKNKDEIEDRFKNEIKSDFVNNNLMQRMTSDIYISNLRKKKNNPY